jgi:hypothetical protein
MLTSDDLYIAMMCLVGFSFEYVRDTFDILIGNLKEIKLNDVFINVFLFIAWLKNWVEVNAKYVYDTYPFVRNNADTMHYAIDYCNAKFNGYRIEPLCDNWISLTTLDKFNTDLFVGDKYVCSEQYYYFKSDKSISTDDLYKQCLEYVSEIAKSRTGPTARETMITMKVSDKYLCSSLFNVENNAAPVYTLSLNKGKNYFLSIEYTHPKMSGGIVVYMPTNVYNATSNILTPAFIKRYLEYQSLPYVFDMRYTLKILDTNINIFNMKSNQHIKLKDRSYDVVTVGTIDEEDVVSQEDETEEDVVSQEDETEEDVVSQEDETEEDVVSQEDEDEDEEEEVVSYADDDANNADDEGGASDTDEDNNSASDTDNLDIDNLPENDVVDVLPKNENIEKELSEIEETKPNILENEDIENEETELKMLESEDILECNTQLTATE